MGSTVMPAQQQQKISPLKRTFAASGLTSSEKKAVKRRASKACASCRSRKVRCNVVEHGAPCTNCRLDEVECVLTESKRKRRCTSNGEAAHGQHSHTHAPAAVKPAALQPNKQPARDPSKPRPVLEGMSEIVNLASIPMKTKPLDFSGHIPHSLYRAIGSGRPPGAPPTTKSEGRTSQSDPGADPSQANDLDSPSIASFKKRSAIILPGFLKPVPTRLGDDEREYLHRKGAFTLPDDELRDSLCQAYLDWVHPYSPILDVADFFAKMNRGDASLGRTSLLVFQALMFTGSAYVPMNLLERAGYSSRKEARAHFYAKTRHLYDFDYEMDRFSQIQALLLMTSWYETPDDKKDAWHWMGIVISTSYTVGMHRDPAHANMDPSQQRQWKRIWWSAIIRDRMLALGLRRPTRIRIEDSDVPLLSIQDFEMEPIGDPDFLPGCAVLHDISTQQAIAESCIQLTKLSICSGDVLNAQYSEQDGQSMRFTSDMRRFLPKAPDSRLSTLDYCKEGLQAWVDQLPEMLTLQAGHEAPSSAQLPASVVVGRGLLHLLYYTTLSALNRPQVLQSVPATTIALGAPCMQSCRAQLRIASTGTMKVARALMELDYIRYLPMSGITALQSAIINQLLDIKSLDDNDRRAALQGFCYCIRAINELADCYTAADHTTALIEAAIRRADIKVLAPSVITTASNRNGLASPPTSTTSPAPTATGVDVETNYYLTNAAQQSHTQFRKATNAADLLFAGVMEDLIPAAYAAPHLPSATPAPAPDRSLISRATAQDTENAAASASASALAEHEQSLADHSIARRLESMLTIPVPVPGTEWGDGMDYWGYAPAAFGVDDFMTGGVGGVGGGAASVPYDFDVFFNFGQTPGLGLEPIRGGTPVGGLFGARDGGGNVDDGAQAA